MSFEAFAEHPPTFVEKQWRELDEWTRKDPHLMEMRPVVLAARAHPQLGRLFPFFSHGRLFFSHCRDYPFEVSCGGICATPKPGLYRTLEAYASPKDVPTTEGSLEEVIAFVAQQLPPDTDFARARSARDS